MAANILNLLGSEVACVSVIFRKRRVRSVDDFAQLVDQIDVFYFRTRSLQSLAERGTAGRGACAVLVLGFRGLLEASYRSQKRIRNA
jgi:hypothetical protein